MRDCWDTAPSRPKSSSGITGKAAVTLHLYGNLGKSTIVVQVNNQSMNGLTATIKSSGKTEQELKAIMNTQVAEIKAWWDKVKATINATLAIIAGAAAAISVVAVVLAVTCAVAFAPAVATCAAAIATIAGLASLAVSLIDWIFSPTNPIESSILELFPASA